MTGLEFRDLRGRAEFRAAEAMQRAVWGQGDKEDPADLMMVIQQEGGIAVGAFEDGQLLGYVFGFPTRAPQVQHSHRLAVLPQGRGRGLGLRLKWFQRDWCLARGITLVRWTFDPLRATNAGLNITRLGAEARTYYPDYYGEMAGINQGTPSDRLLADWHLDSPQVVARALGQTVPPVATPALRIGIPADFGALLAGDPAAARTERLRLRAEMQDAFAKGYAVRGFDPTIPAYILRRD